MLAENCLFPAGSESLFDLDSTYTIEMDAKTDYFARRSNDVRGYDFGNIYDGKRFHHVVLRGTGLYIYPVRREY